MVHCKFLILAYFAGFITPCLFFIFSDFGLFNLIEKFFTYLIRVIFYPISWPLSYFYHKNKPIEVSQYRFEKETTKKRYPLKYYKQEKNGLIRCYSPELYTKTLNRIFWIKIEENT